MKIVKIQELEGTDRDVLFTGGNSIRALVKSDNMGFGVCKTYIPKGGPHHWHYLNHLEACYCISGSGEITNLETKEKHKISPDIMYVLDKNDNHSPLYFSIISRCLNAWLFVGAKPRYLQV